MPPQGPAREPRSADACSTAGLRRTGAPYAVTQGRPATRAASVVVSVGSASAVNAAFVQCAASNAARTVGSGRRVNSSARTCGRIVGLGFVSRSRRAGGTGGSSVRWSGWRGLAATKGQEVVGKKWDIQAPRRDSVRREVW